jgi:Na+(H+)/acetate symporter ActP
MNLITIAMFAIVLLVSLGITAWAARRTRTTVDFYAAGKGLTAAQNGFALAGDWCSAAAFLGFTGLTALYGMDGALYAVGPLVAFCTVLFLIAEPLRNTGTYNRRRHYVPDAPAAGARRGDCRHDRHQPCLSHSANGRRRRSDQAVVWISL